MQVLVVRHAIAEEREAFAATGQDDSRRPLTADGVRKMRRGARGLRTIAPAVDVIATSPLVRAAQTAEILRAEYNVESVETTTTLEPERPIRDVVAWLRERDAATVMIVGHEPQLGQVATYLLGAGERTAVSLKKGAACLLEFDRAPDAGTGRLVWLLPPSVLRDLAG